MEEQSYKEFINEIGKRKIPRQSKIRDSWGVYDAYKHIRKNQWYNIGRPLKENEFYSIIRGINELLADEIAKGNAVVFPSRMGKLELRKRERGVSIVNGKLKISYPVDWSETLKLWFENEEERKKKTLLRKEDKYAYHVKYCKYDATYENKTFYEFKLNRFVKRALKENINQGKIDSLW